MKVTQYIAQEKAIAAADVGGIRARWAYGLRLLRDPDAMSPGGGGLRHGVAKMLVAAANARGLTLSDREIRYRIQCARAYPTESQIGNAVADLKTWHDLIQAGFPQYKAVPDEPLADHRTQAEKAHAAARRLVEMVGTQGTLFPLDRFEPTDSPLKDLIDYHRQMQEMTDRFAERDRQRDEYLELLLAAVGDDVSKTWHEAHQAAFGEPVE